MNAPCIFSARPVALLQLHVVFRAPVADALVVVVHRHAQRLLGRVLTYHVLVQHALDLVRGHYALVLLGGHEIVGHKILAQEHALVADARVAVAADEPAHFIAGLAAEGTYGLFIYIHNYTFRKKPDGHFTRAVGVQVHILLHLQAHERVYVLGQEHQAVVAS